ncbi:glycoside hydrolase family 2 TIM barrel-domain containing protein [Streptomyces caniscabiei]|uniref:Beta galactosidase jelly roll domain-containing protein n=1 Tax=Streptomyces caniscabiei TaxID=2746961 RepID=A0A927L2F7_9ACTN|nr:glycoside hydrolase family 2 TIM barrel-domain containing protein [Streptomyces caniscabiei]MBD9724237.1 beta galactosidase jelly roll domain-containing protein [Streptomyces caniscabiei]MDX3513225.1 glycoside hydrolase family 2 TIM barrel-domain containing protein [Streptomyces caniscabiei]MDX3718726.1 glycoside hydrolase family 2 TIM barrel-domain containing protein [Streptomyces caniscabiei]WEO21881.1 glycoside hydrolase family 2 TIM barrel-domain containing protein [Streptomyces caniscab
MTEPIHPSRRTVVTALGAAAVVALPAWPETAAAADGTAAAAAGGPVLDTHPATEPSGTHVREVGGTGVVFQYGTVLPAFDGWRTHEPTRDYLSLDRRWRFRFDPTGQGLDEGWHSPGHDDRAWGRIGVPAAWDLLDTPGFGSQTAPFGKGTAFADGYAWYRTTIDVPASWRARHVRIAFLAAGYSAEVWLDGKRLGKHEGANSPFALPVAGALRPGTRQTIAVRVFRRAGYTDYTATPPQPVTDDHELPYKPVDYWPYAGLTRSVWIEAVPKVTIAKLLVSTARGRLEAHAVVENHGTTDFVGRLTLDPGRGSGGRPVVVAARIAARSAGVVRVSVAIPHAPRWSPAAPHTLTARATLHTGRASGPRVDTLSTGYGVRELSIADAQLRLNGKPLFLKGLNWHEETAAHGRAMTPAEYDRELGHITAVGANFIRNCVYNRHPYVYDWADEHGVLVMDDIDTMWLNTPQEKLQTERYGLARALALTMAWNQHNLPSVILWCLQNESEIDAGGAPVYRAWLADLKAAVKSVDLTARPVTWASNTSNDPAFDLADVIGFNEYFGYFYGKDADLGPTLDAVHAKYPGKPILITENGTWSVAGTHGPATTQGTEEWQAASFTAHWEQVTARSDFVAGFTYWVLKDYKQRAGYNQDYNGISVMGLVTFDEERPKLVYDVFRKAVNPRGR